MLLPQTNMDGARDFAGRLRKAIETRVVLYAGRPISVTASFGVASYPDASQRTTHCSRPRTERCTRPRPRAETVCAALFQGPSRKRLKPFHFELIRVRRPG